MQAYTESLIQFGSTRSKLLMFLNCSWSVLILLLSLTSSVKHSRLWHLNGGGKRLLVSFCGQPQYCKILIELNRTVTFSICQDANIQLFQ